MPSIRRAGLAAVLVLVVVSVAAASEVFTPHHVARLRVVTSAVMSPDGNAVAFVVSVPRQVLEGEEDGPAWEELHVAGDDGQVRPFITGKVNVRSVRWTPDGRSIAFTAKRDGDEFRAIYAIPADGGEARRLVSHGSDIDSFAFSPDGARVAFLARTPESKEKKELEKKGFTQEIYEEDARPVRVWVADLASGDKPRALELEGSASALDWSPVGDRLVLALAPTPLVDDGYMRRRIHVVDAGTGKVVTRIENPGKLGQIAWSPDGAHLAYISAADIHDPSEGRLMVVPATGGTPRDILPGYEGHVRSIGWSDADTIRFVGDEGVETTVNSIRRDGTDRRVLVPAGGPIVTELTVAKSGAAMALVGESPQHPPEAFVMRADDRAPKRLSTSNPWLADMRFARQEVVRFKARDGLELEGILVRPLDEQPGKKYPLILTVHGGPESHDRNGWKTSYANPGQVGAAQGFAVFYPNYRGSTGRGVAFSKLGQGDPAGREFDDLVDAVDHLVKIGLVDPAKVGITGGSYGGYASAWCATYYTDRFAAAVMFVGISNKISKVGTTDIPNEEFYVHALKRPWDDWKFLLERSPIYYAGQSKTPTLILHGTADPRVSPTQSSELYRHLKLRGKAPVRLVKYPGEQHGNRRAAARLDYNLRMMRWFRHYLQGPGGEPPSPDLQYEPAPAESTATR